MDAATKIQIPNELFAPAESLHFEGVLDLPELDFGPDTYAFGEPVSWSADISNVGDALLVSGTAQGTASTSCARCLSPTEYGLFGEIEGYFILTQDSQAPSELEEDEFDVLDDDRIIDMEPLIKAALLMDLPMQPLCSDDCKGLCPICGANLNTDPCACAPSEPDEPEPADNPFSVLRNLHFGEE